MCLDLHSSTFTAILWLEGRFRPIDCHDVGIKSLLMVWMESGVMCFLASTVHGKFIDALKASVHDDGVDNLRAASIERAVCTQDNRSMIHLMVDLSVYEGWVG